MLLEPSFVSLDEFPFSSVETAILASSELVMVTDETPPRKDTIVLTDPFTTEASTFVRRLHVFTAPLKSNS